MDIKLNPGDILCPNCNGKTYTGFSCIECYDAGKLDWIENIVGKDIPSYFNAATINDVNTIMTQDIPIHDLLHKVICYLSEAEKTYNIGGFFTIVNETTNIISVFIKPSSSSTSSSGGSSSVSHTHSIPPSYASRHNHNYSNTGYGYKAEKGPDGMIRAVPDHNHSGPSHSHEYRGG